MEYSDETMVRFIKKSVCLDDVTLYRYFESGDVVRFRKRLTRLKPENYFENNVYVVITNMLRDIILKTIAKLSRTLRPWGDLIITGGEAFNYYLDQEDKIITSDIDTKFVPRWATGRKYFGLLQHFKLFLWNELGKTAVRLNKTVRARLTQSLKDSKLARFLGVQQVQGAPAVRRRYNLIRKLKQGRGTKPKVKDVLIDVELFSLDLRVKYYSPEEGKTSEHNLGGLLDIVLARPGEVGYDVVDTRKRGIFFVDQDRSKIVFDRDLMIASKLFLVEDLYLIQSLGLRPKKKAKDRRRMYVFCKKVLKVPGVTATSTMDSLFEGALDRLKNTRKIRPSVRPTPPLSPVNPQKYKKYTTPPSIGKLKSHFLVGSDTLRPGFHRTYSDKMFNVHTKRWVTAPNPFYIRNTYKYRPDSGSSSPFKKEVVPVLYSYNPVRNRWVASDVVKKAAAIPFVGLKK